MGIGLTARRIRRLVFVGVIAFSLLQTSYCVDAQQVPDAPEPHTSSTSSPQSFFARWTSFYEKDWKGRTASGPAPARRGLPSPLNSPPFPNADWSYGGSPTLGEADGNVYPLQTAINGATGRTKIYGWIEPTANVSTSRNRNYPETNDIYSNRIELG